MTINILFEIGTEELPATMLAEIFEQTPNPLAVKFKKSFEEARIDFSDCAVYATPRRLVFYLKDAAESQTPKENWVKGPSKQDAYAPDGQPTEKLLGFLKSKKASLQDITIEHQQGREFVALRQKETVYKTTQILPKILDGFVRTLTFSKTMRWDDSGFYFPRPIRYFLCLCDAKPVRFKIGAAAVSNKTLFFSEARRRATVVKNIPAYFNLMKKNGIVLDPAQRKKIIREKLEKLARASKGRLTEDEFLLNEVNFLVENPEALQAPFQNEFLKLPLEVLTVSMARKQRIFGLLDSSGGVLPKFLAILDGAPGAAVKKIISKNYEHILHAKLQDSLFFYQEDLKAGLEKKRQELKDLVFLKGAGSMLEKSDRLVVLAKNLGPKLGLSDTNQKTLERAAWLSKADLLTQMVGEFPELQGVIGKYYAVASGEAQAVGQAIGEQYLPRTVADKLPRTLPGAVLAVLDKADLITACFRLGLEPTSSADPYGLRRSAIGIFKIILDQKINLPLGELFGLKDKDKLFSFLAERLKALLVDRGFREDVVDAVMASDFSDASAAAHRVEALSGLLNETFFPKAWKVAERTVNILKGSKGPLTESVDPALFTEELEKELFSRYQDSCAGVRQAAEARNFREATRLYAEAFFDILSRFFEKVLVNADDPRVRANRLALMRSLRDLYSEKIADLSKVKL